MKNKTLKKTLLISTGLLAAGGICIGIGIAMGGSPVFYLDNEGIHLKETTACPETVQDYAGQKQLAAFEKIEVDLKSGEFSLEEGDSYSVEYLLAGDREEPVCQVENGTLIVKERRFRENAGRKSVVFPALGRRRRTAAGRSLCENHSAEGCQAERGFGRCTVGYRSCSESFCREAFCKDELW